MKIRKFAATLLAMALCLSLCLPAAFAAEQRAEVDGLTVNVQCAGNAGIPREVLTVRLTPRKGAPMPNGAEYLEVTLDTADCTPDTSYTTSATFDGKFVYTTPGNYEYEVVQQPGSAVNGTYDARTMVIHVSASWKDDTFGTQVFVTTEDDTTGEKRSSITFVNRYTNPGDPDDSDNSYDPYPPYLPDLPGDTVRPVVPDAATPVAPPVADARPDAVVPDAATPVNPPVADARPQKLIQTGQLNWPVPLLAGAGAVLMAVGILLHKRKDENA